MDQTTITSSSFKLIQQDNSSDVEGVVSYNATTLTATFDPSGDLSPVTKYLAKITTDITTTAGTSIEENQSWGFKSNGCKAVKNATLYKGQRFNFAKGSIVSEGFDLEYSTGTGSNNFGAFDSENYQQLIAAWQCFPGYSCGSPSSGLASFMQINAHADKMPLTKDDFKHHDTIIWWTEKNISAVQSYTMPMQTTDGKYATVYVQSADASSITFQYCYPYGNHTWK